MTAFAELEISLHRRGTDSYAVELRYSQPESDADIRLAQSGGEPALAQFDSDRLRALALDAEAYGTLLAEGLFNDPDVRSAFNQARSSAQTLEAPLRLRLLIGPDAPELHGLRWETLRDPQDGSLLFTGENILFSRYLSSWDWRPVRLRPQSDLSALVAIANPAGLDRYRLAPVDVEGELARARAGLGNMRMTALASAGSANLNNIVTHLRGGHDILYLVCHGILQRGEAWLWLEDEAGNIARASGDDLLARLNELQQRPRLVVLASCQSAGTGEDARSGDEGALAALGPRLAEAGIPAVLAMQGNVTMRTVADFMPVFMAELQRDGQIDRAMAVARGAVRHRPDWWAPVLFMRLKSGRIWYVPGFAEDAEGFEKWPALLRSIRQGKCTPILGPGLIEFLLGSRREIARQWAEKYHYPLAQHDQENLAQVAQYLAFNLARGFPRDELGQYLKQEIQRRYANVLTADLRDANALLDQLIESVGAQRRASEPAEPHRVLAQLPFPIYVTTNPDNLLVAALVEAGKKPRVELCRWNRYLERLPSATGQGDRPDPDHPLVYHLFGRIDTPRSLVLTEDDTFKYLIGVTRNRELIPSVLRSALADSALLFLGFQADDWNFRVLFHSLMQEEGNELLKEYAHVAVQIDPEDGRMLDAGRARRYLEGYFRDAHDSARISIFWGSVEDAANELQRRWQAGE